MCIEKSSLLRSSYRVSVLILLQIIFLEYFDELYEERSSFMYVFSKKQTFERMKMVAVSNKIIPPLNRLVQTYFDCPLSLRLSVLA